MRIVTAILVSALLTAGLGLPAAAQDLRRQANSFFDPMPEKPPAFDGRTPEKVKLGRMLYLDRRLSESQAISCNSCHDLGLAGADLQQTSIGHGWQFGPRNAPTTFNAVFHIDQFWDGRADTLADQAAGPIANPIEMASTHEASVDILRTIPAYAPYFAAAYPEDDQPITLDNVTDAIAAFESTLTTPNSPFDRWLEGEDEALSAGQRAGLELFMSKGCVSCHSGVALGGESYRKFGVVEMPSEEVLPREDTGRMQVTDEESDEYVFKVPSLRNISLTRPYFHSGAVWELGEAVEIMAETQLGQSLSDDESAQITAFLEALTGERPEQPYPDLPASVDETPRPDPTAGLEGPRKPAH